MYICLRFELKAHFACTKVCEYKTLHFKAKPQKYQTLVPAKNSHIKGIYKCLCYEWFNYMYINFVIAGASP